MRVLVTGGTGFIGRHLVWALSSAGHDVRCLVRSTSNRAPIDVSVSRFIEGEMTSEAVLADAATDVDLIFHAAAMLKVPWRRSFLLDNLAGAAAVARAAALSPCRPPIILLSSLAAGGPAPRGGPRTEADSDVQVSQYGRVKAASERAAREASDGVPVYAVRPPMVFGEGDPWTARLFSGVARGWHVAPGGGQSCLSMIHVQDLAVALVAVGEAALSTPDRVPPMLYVSHPEVLSYRELGLRLATSVGASPPRVLSLPFWALFVLATCGEAWGRLRDRPTLLTIDKYREVAAGSWTCSSRSLSECVRLPDTPSLQTRLDQTAAWYREQGWL